MSREIVCAITSQEGIKIGTDILIYDDCFYDRVIRQGSLALGKTFMLGKVWRSCPTGSLVLIDWQTKFTREIYLSFHHKCFLLWYWIKTFFSSCFYF